MATTDEIARVRKMSNVTESDYTDAQLNTIIDSNSSDLNLAAAQVWEEKAAKAADLVDTTESGSSRKQSVLYDKAMDMAAYFRQKSEDAAIALASSARTRRIVRA